MEHTLLKQIKEWDDNGEYQKIVDALSDIPKEERDYDTELALAKALTDGEQYLKALQQLASVAKKGEKDPHWHFYMGLCYYYLDEDGLAIRAFERALKINPDYANAKELLKSAQKVLSCPIEIRPFRERVEAFWEEFSQKEEELRNKIDDTEHKKEAAEFAAELLRKAFRRPYFQMARNTKTGKYTLILTPEGMRHEMFPIEYWKEKAPKQLEKHWDFVAGRPRLPGFQLQLGQEAQLTGDDVQVWTEKRKFDQIGLKVYAPKLDLMLRRDKNRARSMIYLMVLQCLGERAAMRYIGYLDILERPLPEKTKLTLSGLYQWMGNNLFGGDFSKLDEADPCGTYFGYEMKPQKNHIALRSDVVLGNSACLEMVNEYLTGRSGIESMYRKDGVIAGYLCYAHGKVPANQLVNFRNRLQQKLEQKIGDTGRIIGGAVGLSRSYIDCLCYDLQGFLKIAEEVLQEEEMPMVLFHVFHRSAYAITIKESALEK